MDFSIVEMSYFRYIDQSIYTKNIGISEKLRISSLEKFVSQSLPYQEAHFEKIFLP